MFRKFLSIHKGQRGITGLETAIILIAFVVVAAVFAYTALSAGLFSTQKGQEAVYSGLKEAQSTLELRGNVIAIADAAGGHVKQIEFTVANVLGGESIDFAEPTDPATATGIANTSTHTNRVVLNYIDGYQSVNDLWWEVTKLGNANDNYLLEDNEKFKITVGGSSNTSAPGNLLNALSAHNLAENEQFSLVVQTPVGAVLEIERTMPAYIDTIMNLR